MSIRRLALATVVAAIGLCTLDTAASPATTVIRTDPGGAKLTGTTTWRNTSSDLAVFTTAAGGITCNQAFFDAHVTANHSSSIIGGRLTALTFTSCTDTILAVNIEECALHAPPLPTVWITGTPGGATFKIFDPIVRCKLVSNNIACYYTLADPVGAFNNATSSLTFTNIPVTAVTPTSDAVPVGNCGSNGTFSTVFTHIVDDGNRTITVTST